MAQQNCRWEVHVEGDHGDLSYLADHLVNGPLRVSINVLSGGFSLYSHLFDGLHTSEEVMDIATRMAAMLSGIVEITRGSRVRLRTGAVYRLNANGSRDTFVHVKAAFVAAATLGSATVTITDANGNVVSRPPPPPRVVRLTELAIQDAAVAKAMRLTQQEDAGTWVGLYRVFELIRADSGGARVLVARGWASKRLQERFARSCNSVAVAGDSARHGTESTEPPPDRMSRAEARAFIRYLVEAWLTLKGA